MLGRLRQQFDLLDRDSDFWHDRLIIFPDSQRLDEALLARVKAYLEPRGNILLSHESGLDPNSNDYVLDEVGIEYTDPSPNQGNKGDYFMRKVTSPMAHRTWFTLPMEQVLL